MKKIIFSFIIVFWALISLSQESKNIQLPEPVKTGGLPLMEALANRETSRSFSNKELPLQIVSNLLWAGFGINREDGKRTAPSAHNWLETDLYVFLESGVYVYDAANNWLEFKLADDLREFTGKQEFVKDAPLSIVFIADLNKMKEIKEKDQKALMASTDAAFISQNLYLYCASEGLATGVRAWIDKDVLGEKLGLTEDQYISMGQSVGFPKH
jgi:nitroreductase